MSEAVGAPPASAASAGRLLREARERQGLHIAALAASIKVAPRKLELLEADRFAELPDATFARALAQTVCRALKIDARPVMTLLPPLAGHRLEQVGEGLNAPFRDRPGMLVQRDWRNVAASPAFWLTLLVLGAAVAVYSLPAGLTGIASGRWRAASAAEPARAASAETPGMPPESTSTVTTAVPALAATAPAVEPTASESTPVVPTPVTVAPTAAPQVVARAEPVTSVPTAGAAPSGMLQLRTSSASWVEVTDGRGQPLLSRLLRPGEAVGVDGAPPLKVRIGNAAGTQVVFRGQPTALAAFTRDNVARLELR
ncbi:MAG: RodZ domain-containing protein [Caldimonas sp.]